MSDEQQHLVDQLHQRLDHEQRLRRWESLMMYLTDDGRLTAFDWGTFRCYRIVWQDGMVEWSFRSRLGVAGYVRCRTDLGDPPLYAEELPDGAGSIEAKIEAEVNAKYPLP